MSVNIVNGSQLSSDLEDIADAIRAKTGDSNTISYTVGDPSNFVNAIDSIPSGGGGDLDGTLDGTVQSITSNVTSLIPYALYNITSLTELNLPNVKVINAHALDGCTNAKTSFGSPLTELGESSCRYLFSNNSSESFEVAFEHCSYPNAYAFQYSGITKAFGTFYPRGGQYLFNACTKLIEAHYNLPLLTNHIFRGCTALADLYLENPSGVVTPTSTQYDMQNVPLTCKVHVPDYLLTAYQADTFWNKYDLVGMTTTFTALRSMRSSGKGYVMTDIIPTINTGFECQFIKTSPLALLRADGSAIFGRNTTNNNAEFTLDTCGNVTTNRGTVYIGNRNTSALMTDDTTSVQTVSYDASTNTVTKADGTTATLSSITFASNTNPLCLYGVGKGASNAPVYLGNGSEILYLKLWESGTLSHNLVPYKLEFPNDATATTIYAFKDLVTDAYYQFVGETPTVTYNE